MILFSLTKRPAVLGLLLAGGAVLVHRAQR